MTATPSTASDTTSNGQTKNNSAGTNGPVGIPDRSQPRDPITHKVKSWTWFFNAIQRGLKTHDLRLNDRDYRVGDFLELHDFDPAIGRFSGETCTVKVTYMTDSQQPCAYSSAVLPKEYAILSIQLLPQRKQKCPECGVEDGYVHRAHCPQGD